jgi:hypothetical protein
VKLTFRMCRDGNFMTTGALETENLSELDAMGKAI